MGYLMFLFGYNSYVSYTPPPPLPTPPAQRYDPGFYVAISYAQRGKGPNGDTLTADPGPVGSGGTFSYSAGNTANPRIITGSYSSGTMPGGSVGTGKRNGKTLARNIDGPCVNFSAAHRTKALVPRYVWVDLEPTKAILESDYNFTEMDADLAQCIALDVLWFPLLVIKTFTASESPVGTSGNPVPTYMQPFTTPQATFATAWRWDMTNVSPRVTKLMAAIGHRYDLCSHFGGIATQETATNNADSAATNYVIDGTGYPISYFNALVAESDALFNASPHSRHLAFQNFGGSAALAKGDRMIDDFAARIQSNGAILAGPDLCTGGSVYNRCYCSPNGSHLAGRYKGFHSGVTIGSGVGFADSGPTGCSVQRAEWIGIGPATGAWTLQNIFDYGTGVETVRQTGLPVPSTPNYLNLDIIILDWHQSGSDPQNFAPDAVNLIQNNAAPFGTWVP